MNFEDYGNDPCCSACKYSGPGGFVGLKKVMDFNNGIVIYRRVGKSKNVQVKEGHNKNAVNTIIVQNTSNTDITSEEFLREMQKRKMNCPRCRHIIELALKLLHKIPAINKKVSLSICDHCKFKGSVPCTGCKETTKSFPGEHDYKPYENQTIEIKSTMEDEKLHIQRKNSEPERSTEKRSHQEYGHIRPKLDLDISDLFPSTQSPRSTKSLPIIDKDEKHPVFNKPDMIESVDRSFMKRPIYSKISVLKRGEDILSQENIFLPGFDDNFRKPAYSPSSTKGHRKPQSIPKEKFTKKSLKDFLKEGEKDGFDIKSIITDDKILIQRDPKFQTQKKILKYDEKRERKPLKAPTDKSYSLEEKRSVSKRTPKSLDGTPRSKTESAPDKTYSLEEKRSALKKSPKSHNGTPKSKAESVPKGFKFKFYKKDKAGKEDLRHKPSRELIKETHDKLQDETHQLKRKKTVNRLRNEEELDKKRMAHEQRAKAGNTTDSLGKKDIKELNPELNLINQMQSERRKSLEQTREKMHGDPWLGRFSFTVKAKDAKSESKQNKSPTLESKKNEPGGKETQTKSPKKMEEGNRKYLDSKTLKETDDKSLKQTQIPENKKAKSESKQTKSPTIESKKYESGGKEPQTQTKSPKKMEEGERKDLDSKTLKETDDKSLKQTQNPENKNIVEREHSKTNFPENKTIDDLQSMVSDKVGFDKQDEQQRKNKYDFENNNKRLEKTMHDYQKEKGKGQKEFELHLKEQRDINKKQAEGQGSKIGKDSKVIQTLKRKREGLGADITAKAMKHEEEIPSSWNKIKSDKVNASSKSPSKSKKGDPMHDLLEIPFDKIKFLTSAEQKLVVQLKAGTPYNYMGKSLRQHNDIHEEFHQHLRDHNCPFCKHSELELNMNAKNKASTEYIKGQRIVDINNDADREKLINEPMLFHTYYDAPVIDNTVNEKEPLEPPRTPKKAIKGQMTSSGVTQYVLSDRSFIEKGWTVLPTEKVMRKMNVYRMRPAKPEFDWFKRNRDKQEMFYESGQRFAEYQDDGRCRWYYKNERLALDYYEAGEANAQQRFVIYSNGEPDERGRARPYTVLATFDYLGNGVVFDHGGKIRLKYNQTEGVVLDRSIGPVTHWKWHTLNDPPVLQQVMMDTKLAPKDPDIIQIGEKESIKLQQGTHDHRRGQEQIHHGQSHHSRAYVHGDQDYNESEEMLAIELDNFVKEKSIKLSQNFKPFQIKMKALKINEHFSLKVLDQANVYLIYRDGTTNIKINIGMLLDHREIVDTDTAEVGEVASNLERRPAKTESLEGMQNAVKHAQHFEKALLEREHRFHPLVPKASVDKMIAATSRPLRPPLRAYNASNTTSSAMSFKKPLANNVYYSTTAV